MTNDAKDKPAPDDESGWPVRDTEDNALLDAIACGRVLYREPMEVFATCDPGKFIGAVESPAEIVGGDGKWLLDKFGGGTGSQEGASDPAYVQAVSLRVCRYCSAQVRADKPCANCGAPDDGDRGPLTMAPMGCVLA